MLCRVAFQRSPITRGRPFRDLQVQTWSRGKLCLARRIADPEIGRQLQNAEQSGTYEIVAGRWLVLSASKRHAEPAGWQQEIIFEFVSAERRAGSCTGASTSARRLGCELKKSVVRLVVNPTL